MLPLAIANGAQESDLTTEQQRLTAADEFTQELQTTKHTADYDGSTTTAAAREWLSGIGPDKTDLDAAKSSLSTLIPPSPRQGAGQGSRQLRQRRYRLHRL